MISVSEMSSQNAEKLMGDQIHSRSILGTSDEQYMDFHWYNR